MSWRDLKEVAREFMQKYNQRGQEVPDQTPVEVPFKWRRPLDIHEMIARAVQSHEIQKKWSEEGLESWEEANDFEVEDGEGEFVSPYELTEMQDEVYDSDRRDRATNRRKDGNRRDVAGAEESSERVGGDRKDRTAVEGSEESGPEDGGNGKKGARSARKGVEPE